MILLLSLATSARADGIDPGGHHWYHTSIPAEITVRDVTTTAKWHAAVTDAVTHWNQSAYVHLNYVLGPADPGCTASDWPLGLIQVCDWSFSPTTLLGLSDTFIGPDGVHFSSVLVELNDSSAWGDIRRRHVVCHELGHSLGLDHRTADTSCMHPGDYGNTASEWPDSTDYHNLKLVYNHLDGP